MPATRLTPADHDRAAREVLEHGHAILRHHYDPALLRRWNDAFQPLLRAHVEREGHRKNRGAARYYVTLPFHGLFADPAVWADPDVLAVVERLVGPDAVFCQIATDTPLRGSEHQALHRDAPPLFPEAGVETPPFQLAVNFPLVTVTPAHGPFEVARGTHGLRKEDALARIARGEVALEPVLLELGDVMVRDVRGIHRGTPNTTDEPRPMVVLGYSRRWLFRPEVSIRVPRAAWAGLGARERELLRFNPIVDDRDALVDEEIYQSFAY